MARLPRRCRRKLPTSRATQARLAESVNRAIFSQATAMASGLATGRQSATDATLASPSHSSAETANVHAQTQASTQNLCWMPPTGELVRRFGRFLSSTMVQGGFEFCELRFDSVVCRGGAFSPGDRGQQGQCLLLGRNGLSGVSVLKVGLRENVQIVS